MTMNMSLDEDRACNAPGAPTSAATQSPGGVIATRCSSSTMRTGAPFTRFFEQVVGHRASQQRHAQRQRYETESHGSHMYSVRFGAQLSWLVLVLGSR